MNSVFREEMFKGKTAFLAGATSGINLRIAQRFAELGANVFVVSRNEERVARAVDTMSGRATGAAADVRDFGAIAAAFRTCVECYGEIDLLVSGAAGNFLSDAHELSSNGFRTVLEIDLLGSFHVARAGFEHLRKPGASILYISALQSFMPIKQQAHAAAAKAGIDMMMRTMAVEWGPHGVRVNSIAPGPVAETEGMVRLAEGGAMNERITASIPIGRWADKDDIAELAVFLSSEAARNITGTLIVSDGGYSLHGPTLSN